MGDYLLESSKDRGADYVVGNPPYIRYDDLSTAALTTYRRMYPTMVGRCDIYVAFIEAGLRQLAEDGTLAFICADRWMRSAYGAQLRRLIAQHYSMDVTIEMHDAPAFDDDVAAYPAVIVIRRAKQGSVIVANAGPLAEGAGGKARLADSVVKLAHNRLKKLKGFTATRLPAWFSEDAPWPSLDPDRLALLQNLEEGFFPLEDASTGTKVGIGVATGNDGVYITTDPKAVESDRLLPLAMAADTRSGQMQWSGHFLINPWREDGGLVDLAAYPRLARYFEASRSDLTKRNIAKRQARDWYRTIDRVHPSLTGCVKLYFPDMKLQIHPTLDRGLTYPHHNLYYVISDSWDLEVLGGLLLSKVAELFIEAYCVKMRGGTLRFQAQYLRRIRVPGPGAISTDIEDALRIAFTSRDVATATDLACEVFGIPPQGRALLC